MKFLRFIGRILKKIWGILDVIRKGVANIIILIILIALIAYLLPDQSLRMDSSQALVIRPKGSVVEQLTYNAASLSLLVDDNIPHQTLLFDILKTIHQAQKDNRIKAIVLETDALGTTGLSKIKEIRQALLDFKKTGKKVYAYGSRFDQAQYYLASVADEVYMAPNGFLELTGLAINQSYFKDALDKLGIQMQVFRVGKYKSAVEPFMRSNMSNEERQSSQELLDGVWADLRQDVMQDRHLTQAQFDHYTHAFPDLLEKTQGDTAKVALNAKLVDKLMTPDEWRDFLKKLFGASKTGHSYKHISMPRYYEALNSSLDKGVPQIAVIVAQGAIVDGRGSSDTVGGDKYAALIRAARNDERIKAVVLRIDSPGGSAWASEQIRRELELTAKEKPVIASMSSVAASGGYWIATGAQEIFANTNTITGSIGIFAMLPNFAKPIKDLGIGVDGIKTAPLAGEPDIRKPLSPQMAKTLELTIKQGYHQFLSTVANARHLSIQNVDDIAQGRVWIASSAQKLKLVDKLGGLTQAIQEAVHQANLTKYDLTWPASQLSMREQILQQIGEVAIKHHILSPELSDISRQSDFAQWIQQLEQEAKDLLIWNNPQHIYAHCLCKAP